MSDIFITNQNKNTILNRKGSIEAQKNVINHAVASKFNMSDKKAEDLWKKNLTAPEVSEAADNWNVFDCDNEVEALANVPSADRDTKALKKAIMNRRTTHMAYIDKNTKKGSVRDFLQVCTEVNYHVDYVHNDLFVKDKISQKDAVKNMTSFVNQFIKLEKSIDMKALTEEEKMIVETAAEKVDDQLNLMNSVIDDSFVII